MKVIENGDSFMAEMTARFGPPQEFKPSATYIPAGDCIEFLARPGRYYAQRLDDLVTVYLSENDGEIVGSLIKGIQNLRKELAEKLPGFRINVDDGRVRLEHLFLAHLWSEALPNVVVERTYQKLIEVAGETKAEADLCTV